jgi:14-3-3 protein epsilon
MSGKTRDELIYLARLAEQCERYDEMMNYVIHFCEASKAELTKDEKDLVQDSFKNIVGKRRASWRIINLIQNKKRKNNEE